MALSQVEVPFRNSFGFGIGVNSINASPMGKAIQGEVGPVEKAEGTTAMFEINRIHSTRDLEERLDINAKASYSAGPFANISGRFDLAQSSKIQTSSLCFAITARILLGHTSIADPQLTPAAAALIDNPEMFNARFGDMFVRGIDRGGYFFAMMKLDTSSDEESNSISSELNGTYGFFSAEAKVNLKRVQEMTHSEMSIQCYHEGGPEGLVPKTLDDPFQFLEMFHKWLRSFEDEPDEVARPYGATLAPIVIANGPLPPNAADAEHARDVIVRCAQERSACFDGLNLMDAIIQNPSRFSFTPPVSMASVRAAASGYQKDLDIIAAAASAAMNNPASAKMPAAFADVEGLGKFPHGIPPDPMPALQLGELATLALRGQRLALGDSFLTALRDEEPPGLNRKGFDIGLAVGEDDSLQGPGKEKFKLDHVKDFDSGAYQRAIDFMVDRNANAHFATMGSAAVSANPDAATARGKLPMSNRWLGFNIGAGLFGSVADGAAGHTSQGPGSHRIREGLSATTRFGYDAAVSFYKVP